MNFQNRFQVSINDHTQLAIIKADTDLLHCYKSIHFNSQIKLTDAFGSFWCVMIPHQLKDNLIEVATPNQNWQFDSNHFIFLPAYSLLQWKVVAGTYFWEAYVSPTSPEVPHFRGPTVFKKSDLDFSRYRSNEILEQIRTLSPLLTIDNNINASAIAMKMKKTIDERIFEKYHLSEILKQKKMNPAVVSRQFKKGYGLSPIEYRKRMRIFSSAMELALNNCGIGEIAFRYGYDDHSLFLRQFKEIMNTNPSNYSIKKKLKVS